MRKSALVLVALLASANAFAAGFEKTVLWGGREAGIAGAGTADAKGPSALFFNPANLAQTTGTEVSLNFSPTFAQLQGPWVNGVNSESTNRFIPIFGALISHKLTDKLGIGLGSYIGGGGQVEFNDIAAPSTFTNPGFLPDARSQFAIMEHSLGLGYEVMPGLRIGASWRVIQVNARLTTPAFVAGATNTIAEYDQDLSGTRWNGFRLGASYEGSRWGLGATVRSAVDFKATGDATLKLWNSVVLTTPTEYRASDTSASNRFPLQAQIGGYYDVLEKELRWHLEYSFTDYTLNDAVVRSGSFTGLPGPLATNFSSLANISQLWLPLNIWRTGFEYSGIQDLTVRAGYAFSGQVVPASLARPTFSSPGVGHSFTLGAGKQIGVIDFNGAAEYSFSSGSVSSGETVGPPQGAATGDYKARAYALHLGATYRF
jgi:long-subunit fatty acid transport protein